MRRIFIGFVIVLGTAWPAFAAGEFDGEWSGELYAPDKYIACGLRSSPFKLRVENNRFVGTVKDPRKEQVFEGEIGSGGKVVLWSYWYVTLNRGMLRNTPAKLDGVFSPTFFRAKLYSNADKGSNCVAKILLHRGPGPVTAAEIEQEIETEKSNALIQKAVGEGGDAPLRRKVLVKEDTTAPTFLVANTLETKKATVTITGRLKDDSEIIELSLNGLPATIAADGTFSVRRGVPVGTTEVKLTATDAWGNQSEKTVKVTRSIVFGTDEGAIGDVIASLPGVNLGRYHALVIGNNSYQYITDLQTAVTDAKAVADVLHSKYGFNVELLLNATRYDIFKALSKLRRKLRMDDNLLIYYAGHGNIDEDAERGYWLPVDSEAEIKANWISNADLSDTLKVLSSRHVIVVADSCYSGTLVRAAPVVVKGGGERLALYKRLAGKKSRTVLTSGGVEPVVDGGGGGHSLFAKAFLDALNENNQVIDGHGLFSSLRGKVVLNADQTPEYADVRKAGHDGGDFLFVPRQ